MRQPAAACTRPSLACAVIDGSSAKPFDCRAIVLFFSSRGAADTTMHKTPSLWTGSCIKQTQVLIQPLTHSSAVMVPVAICSVDLSPTVMRRFTSYLYVP